MHKQTEQRKHQRYVVAIRRSKVRSIQQFDKLIKNIQHRFTSVVPQELLSPKDSDEEELENSDSTSSSTPSSTSAAAASAATAAAATASKTGSKSDASGINSPDFELPVAVRVFDDRSLPSFAEAMHLFRNAEGIIGPHGAGLANMLAMKPNAIVYEITANNKKVGDPFELGAHVLGMKYHSFAPAKNPWNGKFSLTNAEMAEITDQFTKLIHARHEDVVRKETIEREMMQMRQMRQLQERQQQQLRQLRQQQQQQLQQQLRQQRTRQ